MARPRRREPPAMPQSRDAEYPHQGIFVAIRIFYL